jgi:hypothetical protein
LRKGKTIPLSKIGPAKLQFVIPSFPLQEGSYEVGLWAMDSLGQTRMLLRNVKIIEVLEIPKNDLEEKPMSDGCVKCNFKLLLEQSKKIK